MKKLLLILSLVSMQSFAAQLYVDQSATGNNDGSSWADAFTNIQSAANAAMENDEIRIAQGTYKEGAEVIINHPITIKGGYPTGGGTQDIDNNPTMIDGNHSHRILKANHTTGTLFLDGLSIQNGRLSGNNNAEGAGVHSTGNLNLLRVKVLNNTAAAFELSYGGGIYTSSGNITLTNSLVSNNKASAIGNNSSFIESCGGGISTLTGSILLTNSKVSNNTAISTSNNNTEFSCGGGIYRQSFSAGFNLINSVVIGNRAVSNGGSVAGGIYGQVTIQNSILWGNTKSSNGGASFSSSDQELGVGMLTANHSVIKDTDLSNTGTGNINATVADFAIDNFIDADNGNFGLKPSSVLIDAGNNSYLPADVYDLDNDANISETIPITTDGSSRIINGVVDIGVFEIDFSGKNYATNANTYYFNHTNTASNQDGLSWATAFNRLNDYFYIVDKSNISQIYLASGNYKTSGTLSFITELTVSGGYDATTNIQTFQKSSIDVQGFGRVIHTSENTTLNHLIITNGLIKRNNDDAKGAGVYSEKNLLLNNTQISNNTSYSDSFSISSAPSFDSLGGGVFINNGNISLTNSQVSNNTAFSFAIFSTINGSTEISVSNSFGGGIYATDTITLINSQVNNNNATSITNNNSASSTDSQSTSYGGGIYIDGGIVTLTNSLINNNTASSFADNYFPGVGSVSLASTFGGGIYTNSGSITLTNSLVNNNMVSSTSVDASLDNTESFGGGIYGTTNLKNSILWGNREYVETFSGVDVDGFNEHENGTLTTSHSLVKGRDLSAENGIDDGDGMFEPLFVNEAAGNFRLLAGSPLIDAGDFNLLPLDDYDIDGDGDLLERIPLDLDGYAREIGLNVDIGPYEFGDLIFRDGFE